MLPGRRQAQRQAPTGGGKGGGGGEKSFLVPVCERVQNVLSMDDILLVSHVSFTITTTYNMACT